VCSGGAIVARLPDIQEASGLAVSRRIPGILWTHNDSGQPLVYAVDSTGQVRARVRVTGASVDDWEDIGVASCPQGSCLFIADIGDNKQNRANITIYRVPEPALTDPATAQAEALSATYPEGPQDAEAFFIAPDGSLYIVTKGEGSPISIYRFPTAETSGSSVRLQRIATLAGKASKERRITDADMSPDGKWVALRTLDSIEFYDADALIRGNPGAPLQVDLSPLGEPQGEGLAFQSDGTLFLAGESHDGVHGGTLARISCKLP
jgi:hypothetical protein